MPAGTESGTSTWSTWPTPSRDVTWTVAFDLTHRPLRFSAVLGNAGVVRLLLKRSQESTLPGRSMMFGGPKGSGKTSLARIVSRAILCDRVENGEPCLTCTGCKSVDDGSSDSFDEFDAATQGTVDRVRDIVSDLEYGTVSGKPRLVILDEAHRLSKQSQDALLKAMEDRRIVVILCTTEPHAIKTAIRSRVEEYSIAYPSQQELEDHIVSVCRDHGVSASKEAISLLASGNGRCPRTALTSLETASVLGPVTVDSVRGILRFPSMEALAEALASLDSDPRAAVDAFDRVFDSEGAVWVRDHVVLAISSGLRSSVGARTTFPVPSDFWASRGHGWASMARMLSLLDKPSQHDVEAILYSPVHGVTTVPVVSASSGLASQAPPPQPPQPPQPPHQPPSPPSPLVPARTQDPGVVVDIRSKLPEAPVKTIEIDGVIFSSSESLTSLDHKVQGRIETASTPDPVASPHDPDLVPMSSHEFARGLAGRARST